jgi:hypothetical protein
MLRRIVWADQREFIGFGAMRSELTDRGNYQANAARCPLFLLKISLDAGMLVGCLDV